MSWSRNGRTADGKRAADDTTCGCARPISLACLLLSRVSPTPPAIGVGGGTRGVAPAPYDIIIDVLMGVLAAIAAALLGVGAALALVGENNERVLPERLGLMVNPRGPTTGDAIMLALLPLPLLLLVSCNDVGGGMEDVSVPRMVPVGDA